MDIDMDIDIDKDVDVDFHDYLPESHSKISWSAEIMLASALVD